MYGAIIGDIIGSSYEENITKHKDFMLFLNTSHITDDTVLTIAHADALMHSNTDDYQQVLIDKMRLYGNRYPSAGYGELFTIWLTKEDSDPYGSYGNGSAMRVSPLAFLCNSVDEVKEKSRLSASVTHNHMEGIVGAEAIAVCVYLALEGYNKEEIREYINDNYYKLDFTIESVRPYYKFNATCPGSVPYAIEAFLESNNYEDAIRNAISLGGDSDTLAAMAGSIAEAFYGIPTEIITKAREYIPKDLIQVIDNFYAQGIVLDKLGKVYNRGLNRGM